LAISLESNLLSPFKKCKHCGSICGPGVSPCPTCSCSDFHNLTVEELKAAADANGKIKAFCVGIPPWPFEGAWQVAEAEKESLEKSP